MASDDGEPWQRAPNPFLRPAHLLFFYSNLLLPAPYPGFPPFVPDGIRDGSASPTHRQDNLNAGGAGVLTFDHDSYGGKARSGESPLPSHLGWLAG